MRLNQIRSPVLKNFLRTVSGEAMSWKEGPHWASWHLRILFQQLIRELSYSTRFGCQNASDHDSLAAAVYDYASSQLLVVQQHSERPITTMCEIDDTM